MKSTLILSVATLVSTAVAALGGEGANTPPAGYYTAGEFSADAFGSASIGQYTVNHLSSTRVRQNTRLGAGAGVNYFITRNLGIGADAYSENTTGVFIDSASANLILRFPLGESGFAPYVFGGGGRHFDSLQAWFVQAGGGLEYRFTSSVGVFIDARGVAPDKAKSYGVGRLGMRFTF